MNDEARREANRIVHDFHGAIPEGKSCRSDLRDAIAAALCAAERRGAEKAGVCMACYEGACEPCTDCMGTGYEGWVHNYFAESRGAGVPAATGDIEWLRGQVVALCEETERNYAELATETESKTGAFARGRVKGAKSIRNAICEVVRERLAERQKACVPNPSTIGKIATALGLVARALKSDEDWTPTRQRVLDEAQDALRTLASPQPSTGVEKPLPDRKAIKVALADCIMPGGIPYGDELGMSFHETNKHLECLADAVLALFAQETPR